MRVEKINSHTYIKTLDVVDTYLVNIVNRFFQNDTNFIKNNIENIVFEATRRIKIDLDNVLKSLVINNTVTSVNNKNGDVKLTAKDLGAESVFEKRSAFNKNFGQTLNTVCQGNDNRLSDARTPLAHTHSEYMSMSDLESNILKVLENNGISILGDAIEFNKGIQVNKGEIVENG